jgi:hypothetical protein
MYAHFILTLNPAELELAVLMVGGLCFAYHVV